MRTRQASFSVRLIAHNVASAFSWCSKLTGIQAKSLQNNRAIHKTDWKQEGRAKQVFKKNGNIINLLPIYWQNNFRATCILYPLVLSVKQYVYFKPNRHFKIELFCFVFFFFRWDVTLTFVFSFWQSENFILSLKLSRNNEKTNWRKPAIVYKSLINLG